MIRQASPWKKKVPGPSKRWREGTLVCCDALDFMNNLRKEIADIVFLDPPFNLGKKYGTFLSRDDRIAEDDYTVFIQEVLQASVRVLKQGGSLFLYHIPQWALRFGGFLDNKMLFRHWIAISMKNGFARGAFLYPAHYALLYFTKGNPNNFHRPKIPLARCRKCQEYVKDYGGYMQYLKDGVNLSDFWEDLSPVRHKNRKNRSANELPLELIHRTVQISGRKGGLLIDPFVGSGTSMIAASESNMWFLACDREKSCFDGATKRYFEYKVNKKSNAVIK